MKERIKEISVKKKKTKQVISALNELEFPKWLT